MEIELVHGAEANLVRAYDIIMAEAERESRAREVETGLTDPFINFGTKERAAIVLQVESMRAEYQLKFGLDELPTLIPAPYSLQGTPFDHPNERKMSSPSSFHRYERRFAAGGLSHIDLAKILLTHECIRRCGETLYVWRYPVFRRLTDNQLSALILGNLRNELGESGNANQITGVATILKAEPTIEEIPLEASDTHFLCVKNGFLDLDTLRLSDPSPALFFTSFISVDWCGAQPCPTFDGFVAQISGGDPILTKRVWQMVGYADGNGNIKPMKNKSTGRIDPTVASIIAMAVWMIAKNQKPDLAAAVSRPGFSL